jgi:NAD(P)-dependent dehydrogenase (short-subunit alcohol dehydrogenase family)
MPRDTAMLQSRREMLKLSTGMVASSILLAAGVTPETVAQSPDNSASNTPADLQNPTTKYPKPPFAAQQQDPPGLACKMIPHPDHGETSYKGSGKLTGRRALITGGDSGIGRAAAIAFAREGADVAFGYLPVEEPDAKDVVKLISDAGRKAVPLPGDIRDEAFCQKLINDAVDGLGGLDILVNNAGKQVYKESLSDISTDQFDATFRTNVYALFWITKAALPHLQPGSSIICTASINSYDPSPGILDYAMTKGAIAIFIKGLAKQLTPKGIRVNGVAPGPVWTPLQPSGGQSPENLIQFGRDVPMGRPGQPAELAPTYVLLASNDSSFMSGEIVAITGGKPV